MLKFGVLVENFNGKQGAAQRCPESGADPARHPGQQENPPV